jgi:ElaB/YqjD/DUF883 family membrane-anchored ribosome-binding protein
MEESPMLDTVTDHISETAHRASRMSNAMAEAFEDGVAMTKRAVKHGCDAAEEFMEDTQQRIKRHPAETVVAAFAFGTLFGTLIGLVARRK